MAIFQKTVTIDKLSQIVDDFKYYSQLFDYLLQFESTATGIKYLLPYEDGERRQSKGGRRKSQLALADSLQSCQKEMFASISAIFSAFGINYEFEGVISQTQEKCAKNELRVSDVVAFTDTALYFMYRLCQNYGTEELLIEMMRESTFTCLKLNSDSDKLKVPVENEQFISISESRYTVSMPNTIDGTEKVIKVKTRMR